MLSDREYNSLLLDYYGDFLTRHQRDICSEYFNEDLSMNEIAENYKVSKSAIQDLIKKTLKKLNEFEDNLKLIEKDNKLNKLIDQMRKEDDELLNSYIDKLNNIRQGE
ncbi:MAG: hypothetical protein J6S49_07610 [Erysipelotrichaceae bacterium]|nr:hypothetical protein [Erysipelotrichaceae bacterium]